MGFGIHQSSKASEGEAGRAGATQLNAWFGGYAVLAVLRWCLCLVEVSLCSCGGSGQQVLLPPALRDALGCNAACHGMYCSVQQPPGETCIPLQCSAQQHPKLPSPTQPLLCFQS